MKKKKLAIVLSSKTQDGGGNQYALLMAECLKDLPHSYIEVIAICTDRSWYRWCKENHIKYISVPWIKCTEMEMKWNFRYSLFSRLYNTYMTELGKIIRREKIDALFLTEQLIYIPNLDVKVITPVHDLMHRYERKFPEVDSDYERRELLFKCQAKYADYILTDSELGKRQFLESYRKNKKLRIISMPFVVPRHIAEGREEYIEVPDKYVFYPAQFWKHKNHINLIKAIQLLKESIRDIHLVLVGSEKNCCREIRKYILKNNLENEVTILGFISNENITYLYKHAVALIMPSYFGPTNIPPLEAMALGCPVAVSNKYAMPEQVGGAGMLFNPDSPQEIADCIRRLWTEEELRNNMIIRGFEKISLWTEKDFRYKIGRIVEDCLRI